MYSYIKHLKRNDAKGAAEAYRKMLLDGIKPEGEMLLMLQDNPDELIELMLAIEAEPEAAAALEKLRADPKAWW